MEISSTYKFVIQRKNEESIDCFKFLIKENFLMFLNFFLNKGYIFLKTWGNHVCHTNIKQTCIKDFI